MIEYRAVVVFVLSFFLNIKIRPVIKFTKVGADIEVG
jgi:hypothetical protein